MNYIKGSIQVLKKCQADSCKFLTGIVIFIFYLLVLGANSVIGSLFPFAATALSWLWFLLPGIILSFALVKPLSLWERLPIAMVLTIGLCTPVTVAAILLRLSLPFFLFLHSIMLLITIAIFLIGNKSEFQLNFNFSSLVNRIKFSANTLKGETLPFLLLIVILSGLLISLSYNWPLHGDDIAGLSIFSEVIQQNRITGTEPFHGTDIPSTPRNELIVWTYMEILVNKASNVYSPEFIINSRPILVLLAILSLFTFLRHYFREKRLTLFLLSIWLIYLLATSSSDGTGSNLITRIFQDKFMGWFVVIPVVLVFMLWFIEERCFSNLLLFGIIVFGASMVHPITLVQAMILIGGFGLVHFGVEKSNEAWRSIFLISIVLLISLSIPIFQFLRYNEYFPLKLVGLADVVELGRLNSAVNRYRLWLLNGDRLILHPSVFLQPVTIIGYLISPFIFYRKQDHFAARLIGGSLLLLPFLLYFPPLAYLVGKVVTPYLLWRLAWPIPLFALLTMGWGAWLIFQKMSHRYGINEKSQLTRILVYSVIIIFSIVLAVPKITQGLNNYYEKRAGIKYSTCVRAENVLFFIDTLASQNAIDILASPNLNYCIPAYAGLANVVEFRGYGTVNRLSEEYLPDSLLRLEDVDYFSDAVLIDDQLLEILNRYNIDYVLVEKDNMDLELQLKYLTSHFVSVYEDADFNLFEVNMPLTRSLIIEANSKLRSYEFEEARNKFNQILQKDPKNILAFLGLGIVYEGTGDVDFAIESYQQAIGYVNNEPGLYAHLANAYVIMGDYQKAIEANRLITAFTTNRFDTYEQLGQLYIHTGNEREAKKSFTRAALLKAQKGTAAFHLVLGDLYKSVDMLEDTVQLYEEAVSIDAASDNLLRLARVFSSSGSEEKAVEVYRKALLKDRWGYHSHLDLGFIYLKQDRLDEAIEELEKAIRLRPTGISAYILLGQAIQEKSGSEIAIQRMEELKSINSILPGPYRSKAMLLLAYGDTEGALNELKFNLNIQPKSAAISSAQGFILMADRKFEEANSVFNQVLSYDPKSLSAHIGLSIVYGAQNKYDLESNHLAQIVGLNPMEAWPHLLLAEAHMRQGNVEDASSEIELAIGLRPTDPAGYLARGDLLSSQMDFEQAIENYSAVLEVDQNNIEALRGLGNVYQKLGEMDLAESVYLKASEMDEGSIFSKIKLAEIYREQGLIEEAISLEEAAYILSPDSDLVVTKLAQTYRLQGRIEEAKSLYENVINKEAHKVYAYAALAQLMAEEENDQYKIYALFSKLVQENTESAEAYLNAGKFSMSQGRFDQAEHLLMTSLDLKDVSIQNYLSMSDLYKKQGDWENALLILQINVKKFPKNALVYNNLAEFYLKLGDLENAAINYEKVLEFDPGLISALIGKSQIELINGNIENAEELLKNAYYKNQNSPQMNVALANFYESIGNPLLAEPFYEKAMLVNPKDIIYYEPVAQFYIRQKNFDKSLSILQDALLLFGSKLDIYLSLGDIYVVQGQYEAAINVLNSASEIDRSDVRPYLALSDVYWLMGDWKTAKETLETALYIEPASVTVNLKMGTLWKLLSREEKAIDYFERAVASDRSQVNSLIELAKISKNNESFQQAITYLEKAKEIDPTNLNPYSELSGIYQLMGDHELAENVISLAIDKTVDKNSAYLAQASLFENQQKWVFAKTAYENARNSTLNSKQSGINLVHFMINRNDMDAALAVLDQLQEDFGPDSEISVEFGNIYFANTDWEKALSAYEQAKGLNEKSKAGYLGLASTYIILGEQESAIREYRLALDNVTDLPGIYYNQGTMLRNKGEFLEAYRAFQKVLQIDPWHRESLINVEQLDVILGNPRADLTVYIKNALQVPSKDAFITIAKIHQLRGEWPASLIWIMKAIEIDPFEAESWLFLGNYYQSLGQWDKALEAYDEAIRIQPISFDAQIAAGSVQVELGMFDEAKNHFQNAIEFSPGKIEGYASVAKVNSIMGDTELSLAVIHEGIALAPGDYRGYQVLCDLMIEINPDQYLQADEVIQQSLIKFPGIADLYAIRGRIYSDVVLAKREKVDALKAQERSSYYWLERLLEREKTADSRSASRAIERRIEEAKQQYDSFHKQVLALKPQNEKMDPDYEAAMKFYDKALMLEPYNEIAIIGKGRLITSNDTKDESIFHFEHGYIGAPYSSSIGGYLGSLYNNFELPIEAISVFNQILRSEPGNLVARIGILDAYELAPQLSISQAAHFVQLSSLKFPLLVENLRIMDRTRSN